MWQREKKPLAGEGMQLKRVINTVKRYKIPLLHFLVDAVGNGMLTEGPTAGFYSIHVVFLEVVSGGFEIKY